ncbi:glycoside hydrolase family 3 N-terminal domain-containing protein [Ruminococcus sp.]|uniref:glycoside hydrolase family 3 N-terminal domain-containing protein n=1 Tax=Ruminococcus sp. TaxID=41978 RepID=UPI0025D989F0|nr:glycoside hydrolase family 3 N-terminal domain-containing protein [Ruminococcus sp.]MBQ8966256.1 glycoside hydrolase family 3 [Ruminococcus sp.]
MSKKITAAICAAVMALCAAVPAYAEAADASVKGDINGDTEVNVTDVTKLAAHVKSIRALQGAEIERADLNGDGDVNVTDLTMLAAHVKGIRSLDGKYIYDTKAEKVLAEMTLHQKICQMFLVTPESLTGYGQVTQADSVLDKGLENYPVSGIILFDYNLVSKDQTRGFISTGQQYNSKHSSVPLFFAVDEEGGTVARCAKKLGTTSFYNMYNYRYQGTQTAYNNAWTIANDIASLGFNLDFAPVADTWSNPNNTVIGWRAYSDNFSDAATLVASAVKGFNDGGVACTLKHWPGHGDTATDSHVGMACSYKTMEQLEKQEFLAFESGIEAGADMVMVGHITMTNIDNTPASISPVMVNDELRGKLGYDGVVVTDALGMGAVANYYDSATLAVKCVQAGDDLLLMPADLPLAVKGLEDAVANGTISEERIDKSVMRILSLKEKRGILK